MARVRVCRYLDSVIPMVREMEAKMLESEDLLFWRDAARFWLSMVPGYAPTSPAVATSERESFARFLDTLVKQP